MAGSPPPSADLSGVRAFFTAGFWIFNKGKQLFVIYIRLLSLCVTSNICAMWKKVKPLTVNTHRVTVSLPTCCTHMSPPLGGGFVDHTRADARAWKCAAASSLGKRRQRMC